MVVVFILAFVCLASLSVNAVLTYLIISRKKRKTLDTTAQQVLSELMAGPAIIKVEVIDRGSLIQWKGGL